MPSKTPKQRRFMAAAAHDPAFAAKAGIKQSVAEEFNEADTVKRKEPPYVARIKADRKRKY